MRLVRFLTKVNMFIFVYSSFFQLSRCVDIELYIVVLVKLLK